MDTIALDVKLQLSALHDSNINVQVQHCPVVAPFGNSGVGLIVTVTSSSISALVAWCQSSKMQCYIPVIHQRNDIAPVPNQGQFALCLSDESLIICGVSLIEVCKSASEANLRLGSILACEHHTRDDPLDSLGLVPFEQDVFNNNWLDESESGERPIPFPFLLDGQISHDELESMAARIFMHPPTPRTGQHFGMSPVSSEDSLSPGSSFYLSPISSPGSTLSQSPGYYLESNSGRYNASLRFIPNDIPLQSTVSPRDVCPGLGLIDAGDPMDMDTRINSPSFASVYLDMPLMHTSQIPSPSIPDSSSLQGAVMLPHTPSLSQVEQNVHHHMRPLIPSPLPVSSDSVLFPMPSTSMSSLAECTHLPISSRKLRRGSRSIISHSGCSSDAQTRGSATRRGKLTSDDDDDYIPVPRAAASGVRKVTSDCHRQKPRHEKKQAFDQNTKYPKKHRCPHCNKTFTRGTDVTRHLLTCKTNPEREQKGPCHYCGGEAPIRGDSAKRHRRSDACHFAALARGVIPYPRDEE